ncbi:MAG: carbohydrate-binding protein [Oscillospiraceae bacterium]|nr:carbohydrate-binding protein [Oscillospiraceae bacterium]
MKLRKVVCSILACAVLIGEMGGISAPKTGDVSVKQVLSGLSLNAEPFTVSAATNGNFRRPVNNETPMWIIHVDSWNYADPEKIIELVPEDILPYVVFNLSLSINWSSTEHKWLMVQDGIETARSWMKAAADKGVWTMIQPASGGQCHFPDYKATDDLDNTIFGEFFRDYPNFLGYNYCEQFWGFASQDFPVTYQQRYDHFSALLKLCNKYGGYLDISWCENQWGSQLNPVAMLKTNSNWENAARTYSENLILEEKYTQSGYIAAVESEVYGAYISGYCGNYGVRWDDTGWTDYPWNGGDLDPQTKDQYKLVTSAPILLERMVQNGMTVVDGPELIWADCIKENWIKRDAEGYEIRNWSFYDQFQNDFIDIYRKFNEGAIRIPTREEVINRTKVVVIQDVNSGGNDDKYCIYKNMFEGLYRAENDGNLKDNHNPFKSTGRYQTIPVVYALTDDLAKSIPVQIKQSSIASRWNSIEAKQAEFDKLYAQDYWGNCYAGRNENTWVTYNPYKSDTAAGGYLNLKYNTCKQVEVTYPRYGTGLINEYSDHIDFYLTNYDEDDTTALKTDTIKISGCASEPTITYTKDRGVNQPKSEISTSFSEGTYTITVKHNGPVDISVKCSGNETGRQTSFQQAKQTAPEFPSFYEGTRQFEAENFDRKNIEENITNACRSDVTGCWGMGFMKFGKSDSAVARDYVSTTKAGTFDLTLRYSAVADINNVDLVVNDAKVKTLSLPSTSNYSKWNTVKASIELKAGENKIEFKANSASSSSVYLDCFQVSGDFGDGNEAPPEPIEGGKLFTEVIIKDKENRQDWSVYDDFGKGSKVFGDREIFAATVPAYLRGAEAIRTACDSKMYEKELGSFVAGDNMTLYIAADTRVVEMGLPEWFSTLTDTKDTITLDNELVLEVYKREVKKGEQVTLGTNGGNGNNVCYIALAVAEGANVIGDVNMDGQFTVIDVVLVQKWILAVPDTHLANWKAGDFCEDDELDIFDLGLMKRALLNS